MDKRIDLNEIQVSDRLNQLKIKKKKKTEKQTHMYLLPVGLRSTTWTIISGRSEEESGDGFAKIVEIASGLTLFAIVSLSEKVKGKEMQRENSWKMK